MWQCPFYLGDIVDGRLVRIVVRYVRKVFVLFDIRFDLTGKLYVGGMSRPVGYDMCFDRMAYKCQVANYIQQLVPGRFVGEMQLYVVLY